MELRIETIDDRGDGIARAEDMTLHVAGAAVGDHLQVHIVHKSPHRPEAWATIVEVLEPGPDRRQVPCPRATQADGECGGCPLIHLTPEAQRLAKGSALASVLAPLGVGETSLQAVGPDLAYRNRGHFVVATRGDERIRLGAYAPRSHDVIRTDGCRVLRAPMADVAKSLESLLFELEVPVFPEPGGLRHVTLRANPKGDVLVDLVTGSGAAWETGLAARLLPEPGIVGVMSSVNDKSGNAIRVAPSRTVLGLSTLVEPIGNVEIEVSAEAFLQLNSDVAAAMYRRAAEAVESASTVWDLYCGVGAFGISVGAQLGAAVFGAEMHEASVALATKNAKRNDVTGTFVTADLRNGVPEAWPVPELLLVNPPRRGLDAATRTVVAESKARKVAYMSCSPKTFVRDAKVLVDAGWKLDSVEAFDMLPNTPHVELLGLFGRA